MLIRADVKCYYCGHISGQVEGDPDDPKTVWRFHPISLEFANQTVQQRHTIRCTRCGGPVFLDEIETVRSRTRAIPNVMARAS